MPILLKDLLKESPEEVIISKYAKETLKWHNSVAYTFITFPTFSLVGRNIAHGNILRNVNNVMGDAGDVDNVDELKKLITNYFGKIDLSCSNIDAFIKDYNNGVLHKFIKTHGEYWFLFNMSEIRSLPDCLFGRVWPENKIISCWSKLDDIKRNWHEVKDVFLRNASTLGKLDDYTVDYSERDGMYQKGVFLDFIPAKDIKTSSAEKSTLTPEEILDLKKKLHTLRPDQKKQAMIKLGMVDFNAASGDVRTNFMRGAIAEGRILLKHLLNEIKNQQDSPQFKNWFKGFVF